jgi:hypothetical protein
MASMNSGAIHETSLDARLRGPVAQPNGQMRLAHAGGADQHDILFFTPGAKEKSHEGKG